MPHRLKDAQQIAVGAKQTLKAVNAGQAKVVYLAGDADPKVVRPVSDVCAGKGVTVVAVESMLDLGRLCRIEVGAAAAAILEP